MTEETRLEEEKIHASRVIYHKIEEIRLEEIKKIVSNYHEGREYALCFEEIEGVFTKENLIKLDKKIEETVKILKEVREMFSFAVEKCEEE